MAGVNYTISNQLRLGVEYKYFAIPRIYYANFKSNYKTNEVLLRVSFLFNQTSPFNKLGTHMPNHVDTTHRFYIAAEGGASIRDTQPYGAGGTKSFPLGSFAGIALGYHVAKWLRVEAELNVRQNEVERVLLSSRKSITRPSGDETIIAPMLNAYISPWQFHGFTPFIGAGIGYAYDSYAIHVNLPPNFIRIPPTFPTFKHPRRSDTGFAYQLMAGISYPLTQRVIMSVGYRYFRMNGMHYVSFNGAPPISSHIAANTATLRLTYLLGST